MSPTAERKKRIHISLKFKLRPADNLRKYKKKQTPKNLLCIYDVCKVLCFILFDDDLEIKSKIYSLICLSCFIYILSYKMSLFSGICFFLYFSYKFSFEKTHARKFIISKLSIRKLESPSVIIMTKP